MEHRKFLERSFELALDGCKKGEGGPFGALITKSGKIIAEANNQVLLLNDPSAHAEIQAIRKACTKLGGYQLEDCVLYTSCEPCPMCLGAIYWARPKAVYFGASKQTAAAAGFDDEFIYMEIPKQASDRKIPFHSFSNLEKAAQVPFEHWKLKEDKLLY